MRVRLLDRYLLRELALPLVYCLSGFLIFWISSDLLRDLDSFQQERLTALDLIEYYVLGLPELLVLLLPIILLLALLYALTNHARHNEITAMRAAGISLWRVCLPYFLVAWIFSLAIYVMDQHVVPSWTEQAQRLRRRHVDVGAVREDFRWKLDLKFYNERDGRFWRIRAYNVETGEMQDPYVEWRRSEHSARLLLSAERGYYEGGVWTFYRGRLVDTAPDTTTPAEAFEVMAVPEFSETPERIRSEFKVRQLSSLRAARKAKLTVAEILDYRWLHPELRPRERALLDTQLHRHLATPWTCFVVALIAIPFGAASGRRNVFVGVANSLFICFVYYVLQELGFGLGTAGLLPPALAMWFPNVSFGTLGVILTLRAR